MGLRRSSRWETLWILATLIWIVALGVDTFKSHQAEAEWLNYWADSFEWVINADPMVPVSAKEVRAMLGDEKFIASAARLYPKVNLQETLRRYESAKLTRPYHEHVGRWFVLWALVPPLVLYGVGIVVGWVVALGARLVRPKGLTE